MKRLLLLELCFLFLATTFQSDNMTGWVQQTIPRQDLPIMDLRFIDSLNGYFVSPKPPVDTSFIFKTTDGGNNWLTTHFDSLYLVCKYFVNKDIGFCGGSKVGSGVLKKTTDGGNNWFTVSEIPFIIIRDVFFVNKDTGWICHSSVVNGGLWRTTNGGLSWQMQLNENYNPSKIFFVNSNTGWVIGNSQTKLYKTTNCGVNWFLPSNEGGTDVFFSTPDSGWIIGGMGSGLDRTTNGGYNWYSTNIIPPPAETKLFFIDNKRGWGGSGLYKIYVTKDGFNWGYQTSPNNNSYNIWFPDSLHGWAGYGGLLHTIDGGGPITYTGIRRNGEFIPSFELEQNYPNPFNPSTKIKFSILKSCTIELRVFDITGKEIAKPKSGQEYNSGEYTIDFNAVKYSISSGIYFYTMRGETTDHKEIFIDTKKLVYVK